MYKYSPIKKLYIKNFRNIGEAIIDFEDSPIVSLIGENEAGKTSVVKAFSVCALHSTPRDQKDYIRDGTGGFGVAIELNDGTMITRMKTPTINQYNVKKPDGTEWDTSKIDSGLPLAVQQVMGLIEEPETKEYLQVRTYENQLLFVVTPASTNYKVMYDALKVDQLTRAIKLGSKEANSLKSEIDTNDSGIYTLTENLRQIRTFDITPLLNIKSRLANELRVLEKIEAACELLSNIEQKKAQLGSLNKLFSGEVSEVNEVEASNICGISRILNNIDRLTNYNTELLKVNSCEIIDMSIYNSILSILTKKDKIDESKQQLGTMIELNKATEINEVELDHLQKAYNLISDIQYKKRSLSVIEPSGASLIEQKDFDIVISAEQIIARIERQSQLKEADKQVNDYCNQVSNYLKSLGAAVETCPSCGESIVIDVEKYA